MNHRRATSQNAPRWAWLRPPAGLWNASGRNFRNSLQASEFHACVAAAAVVVAAAVAIGERGGMSEIEREDRIGRGSPPSPAAAAAADSQEAGGGRSEATTDERARPPVRVRAGRGVESSEQAYCPPPPPLLDGALKELGGPPI